MIDIKICENCKFFVHEPSSVDENVEFYLCKHMYKSSGNTIQAFGMTKQAYENSWIPDKCEKQNETVKEKEK